MTVFLLGVNHHTAGTDLRGRLVLAEADLPGLLPRLRGKAAEVVALSTCNRTEVYASADTDVLPGLLEGLCEYTGVPAAEIAAHSYTASGEQAVRHLMSVAAGLDSVVIGEPQILGQVRHAWEAARDARTTGPELNTLFRHALEAGKEVRSHTVIARGATSVAHSAVELARREFGTLDRSHVVVLGAGETGRVAALNLLSAGAGKLSVTNRTWERAEALARSLKLDTVLPLEQLPEALHDADMLIACSASPRPLVTKEMVLAATRDRADRPLLLMDISVPRNVEASVRDLPGVLLFDMDDIQQLCERNKHARCVAAKRAERNITAWAERYMRWQREREAVPFISRLHAEAEQIRRDETEQALRSLPSLAEHERQAVEAMGRAMLNRLLHQPTVWLRERSTAEQRAWIEEMWDLGPGSTTREGRVGDGD